MPTFRRLFVMLAALLAAALLTSGLVSGCSKKPSEPLPEAAGLIGAIIVLWIYGMVTKKG